MDSSAANLRAPSPAVATAVVATAAAPRASLLSPTVDVLMIGGLSLFAFVMAHLFVDKGGSTTQIAWATFYMAFWVNNPHFMASYQLLYWDKRRELFTNRRFLWAGVIAPLLVLSYMAGCVALQSPKYLGYAVNVMFFTVGWHYIKQIYGTVVVTCAKRGYYFSKSESRALKLNLFPIWFMSYFSGNIATSKVMQYSIAYETLAFPAWFPTVNYIFLAGSLAGLVAVVGRKWWRDGLIPPWSALVSFASIYCWYLPDGYHAIFWYLIPFFHSLQYLLFVTALKKNQYTAEAAAQSSEPQARRAYFAKAFFGFAAVAGISAFFVFRLLPDGLDRVLPYDRTLWGKELAMFFFITFINIHHYFIDNVLWRNDNPAVRRYL